MRPRLLVGQTKTQNPFGQLLPQQSIKATMEDKSITSSLFLFSGLYVCFARIARSFWRFPMFYDATEVYTKCVDLQTKQEEGFDSGKLTSWVKKLVYRITSLSSLSQVQIEKADQIVRFDLLIQYFLLILLFFVI